MEKVVITGMGTVNPIGNDVAEFESNLFAGRHGIAPIDHFDTADVAVSLCAPVKDFDPASHFPARELRRLDAYSRFGLVAAREAVEDAKLLGAVDPYRLGVFMSSGLGGVETALDALETMREKGPRRVSPVLIPKWIPNMLGGVLAIEIDARGPSVSHSAACATSSIALGEAMRTIRHGYADAVVCGGAEAVTQKLVLAGFQNLRALTTATDPDRASLPFDRERGGFVMGEGAAALVLESESHARARGAEIYAEVSGYGATNDASHITAPAEDGGAIDRAIGDALAEAGEREGPVHVNAHGTGTVKSDQVEGAAIGRVFGDRALVSSTKSMTGHLFGAAGAVEAVASVLALRRGAVPATVGTTEIDRDLEIDVVRGRARPAPITRAVSLALGFGGHNVSLVIDGVRP